MSATAKLSIGVRVDDHDGGGVATVTVDNQARLNVIDSALMRALVGEIEALGARDDLRAVVLRGAGDKAFIGGANISRWRRSIPRARKSSSPWCIEAATACGRCRCR